MRLSAFRSLCCAGGQMRNATVGCWNDACVAEYDGSRLGGSSEVVPLPLPLPLRTTTTTLPRNNTHSTHTNINTTHNKMECSRCSRFHLPPLTFLTVPTHTLTLTHITPSHLLAPHSIHLHCDPLGDISSLLAV